MTLPVRYRWTLSYTDLILFTDIRRLDGEGDGGAVEMSGVSIALVSSGSPSPCLLLCITIIDVC